MELLAQMIGSEKRKKFISYKLKNSQKTTMAERSNKMRSGSHKTHENMCLTLLILKKEIKIKNRKTPASVLLEITTSLVLDTSSDNKAFSIR